MSTITTTNWSSDRLKDVSAINLCALPANTADDFTFRYLEISNVNYYGVISEDAMELLRFGNAPSRARRVVKKGDVLVSSVRPNLQAIAHAERMCDELLVCSTGFNVVIPRLEKVANRFLYYFLLSEETRQHFEAVAKGVGYPAIDDKDFCSTDVPLPPLPEQKRIAAYLDASCAAIDRTVETKQKQLETLDALRKSIIQRAVIQGLNPKVQMKESGVEWLGPIPENWKIEKLKRCGRLKGGAGFPHDEQGVTDAEIPFYKVKHLQAPRYLSECDNFVSAETARRLGAEIMPPDTIVFAKVGAALLLNRFRILTRPSCIDNNMMALLIERNCYRMSYFYHLLNLLDVGEFANQGPVPSINGSQVGGIRVPIPPANEQDEIVEFVEKKSALYQSIAETILSQITTLTAYRKSLIHECVTGKRRISDSDVAKVEAHV